MFLKEANKFAGGFAHPTLADFSLIPALYFVVAIKVHKICFPGTDLFFTFIFAKDYKLSERIRSYMNQFAKTVKVYKNMRTAFDEKTKELAKNPPVYVPWN